MKEASAFFPEPHNIVVIIKILSIPFQDIKQLFAFIALFLLALLFNVGCHHHKQAVWADSTREIRVITLVRKNIFH